MLEGFEPVVVDTLGGLCTLVERSDLPLGLSPLAKNVEFFPGGVRTRDGFKAYLSEAGSTNPFRTAFDHVDGRGTRHHMIYQGGTGKLGSRTTGTTINSVVAKLGAPSTFSTMRATSLYGRVFMCVSDGRRGLAPPFQWDGNLAASAVGATGAHEATISSPATGSMVGGLYYIVIAFETATGYITGATKLNYDTISNNDKIDLSSIPIGPPGTTKRRIFISLVDTFELYNPGGLVINDNTTTTFSGIDLTQAEIAAGLPFIDYATLHTPAAHLGVEAYSNRLVFWGGDGKIASFFGPLTTGINPTYSSIGLLNLDFSAEAAAAYTFNPLSTYVEWEGVTPLGTGTVVAGSAAEGETLNYYRITSAGGATDGLISQGSGTLPFYRPNRDVLGTYYLNPGRRYGIRARVRNVDSAASGSLKIVLNEVTGGGVSTAVATLTVPMSSAGAGWAIYESDGSYTVTAQPSVGMTIYTDTVPNGKKVDVTRIEVYDVETKRGHSTLNISRAFDPESLDAVTGVVQVSPNNGEEIRNVFPLRGNLYICKEGSLYVTQDSGQEPAFWNVEIVSSTVGTPSVHGVGLGDGWAVIVSRDGLYMFDGGAPQKVSQEIQPTWDLFDWTKGERMFCAVNTSDRHVIVGGPTSAGGYQQLRLNYVDGWESPIPSGNGRKWSTDTRYNGPTEGATFVHAAPLILDSGLRAIGFCHTDAKNGLSYIDKSTRADFSGAIDPIYETAPIGTEMMRSLFGEIAMKVRGSGTLTTTYVRPDASLVTLPGKTLSSSPLHDIEVRTHRLDTQLGVRIGVTGSNAYFIAKRIAVWVKTSPFSRLRGY